MTQSDNSSNDTAAVAASNPTSSFSLEQYYREKLANVRQQLPEVARQLKDAGVVRVQILYDGCGDSGQIESIAFLDDEGKRLDLATKVSFTEAELMELFYDLTQARHPGWENNDGACGEFEWDLAADTLEHTHNDRFTDYHTTEHQGL